MGGIGYHYIKRKGRINFRDGILEYVTKHRSKLRKGSLDFEWSRSTSSIFIGEKGKNTSTGSLGRYMEYRNESISNKSAYLYFLCEFLKQDHQLWVSQEACQRRFEGEKKRLGINSNEGMYTISLSAAVSTFLSSLHWVIIAHRPVFLSKKLQEDFLYSHVTILRRVFVIQLRVMKISNEII